MTSIEQKFQQLKLDHYGQCPREKGHTAEGTGFLIGIFFGALLIIITLLLQDQAWETWAISKGYAVYTLNGKVKYQ